MRKTVSCLAIAAIVASLTGTSVCAQNVPLRIWPGIAPGSEHSTQKEATYENTPDGTVVLNVVAPTLTPYLPAQGTATGTGIIVAPGGYCLALAISKEGTDVARWFQSRGVAAFVLKYRLAEKTQPGIPNNLDMDAACKDGIADGVQAIKVVREHAKQWGLSADRIGFIGFSAGGMIASGVVLQPSVADRPDFAAFIYGAPFGAKMPIVPAGLPPIFMAWAQDDPIARDPVARFYDALQAAGNKPEAHIFSAGGHGFGVSKQGTTSDHWIDEFYYWLQAHGFAK